MSLSRPSLVAGTLVAALLAGCSGSGGGGDGPVESASSAMSSFFRGSSETQTPITEQIPQQVRCPRVRVQPTGEVLRRDDGSGDPKRLNWQASVMRVARECTPTGDGAVVMRIGIAGRFVQGGAGAPARVDLPVRITLREGADTTFDERRTIAVSVTGPSLDWAYVEENVVVRTPNAAEVSVGFES